MICQNELRKWLKDYWGLELTKNSNSRTNPYVWTTGWTVSGSLPGCSHNWYWFRKLKNIAEHFGFKK